VVNCVSNDHNFFIMTGPTKSRPEPSGTVRTEPPGAVWTPPGAVRMPPGAVPTPPVIQLLNIQKEINRTQITCSLLAQYLHFVMYKTNMEKMRKIMSLHVMRKLIDYKLQNVAPFRND